MRRNAWASQCKKHLASIKRRYKLTRRQKAADGHTSELRYQNDTTGLVCIAEYREQVFGCKVCQLHNGEFVEEIGEITPTTRLWSYDLEDLFALRTAPLDTIKEGVLNDEQAGFADMLSRYAKLIPKFADDVLRGDFTVFSELDRVVKERAREAAYLKWGRRASRLGW
jgi:hypothetical protein